MIAFIGMADSVAGLFITFELRLTGAGRCP